MDEKTKLLLTWLVEYDALYNDRLAEPEDIYKQFLEENGEQLSKLKNFDEATQEAESTKTCCAQSSSTTKNKDGLLPCPFCGNEARIIYKGMWKGEKQYDIGCTIGGIGGACIAEDGFDWNFFESDKQRFIGYWNKRA